MGLIRACYDNYHLDSFSDSGVHCPCQLEAALLKQSTEDKEPTPSKQGVPSSIHAAPLYWPDPGADPSQKQLAKQKCGSHNPSPSPTLQRLLDLELKHNSLLAGTPSNS